MSVFDTSCLKLNPKANEEFVIGGKNYRITVLTEQLMRLEYSADGVFEDRATRFAANRNFAAPKFKSYEKDGCLHIVTEHLHLTYDKKEFSPNGLKIVVDGSDDWCYNAGSNTQCFGSDNYGGTCRTLDNALAEAKLDDGLLSKYFGFTTFDDSKTIAIGEDGWPTPASFHTDIYFFGYGKCYQECIRDFYKLSGKSPLLPRYTLGNWWSRYHAYSDTEYKQLLKDFADHDIPLSVGILDMDWHITETPDPHLYGGGWTGYTWNKELFPDHKEFLDFVHNSGLKMGLNLHPKDGVRAYEEPYPAIAEELGLKNGEAAEFDVSDEKFMDAYFRKVLNPYEEEGVDFWWIDWQQTGHTKKPDYDILWMLNHCHYIDSARNGNRPLTLSRYAGVGSHRYPLGFSGDTGITWEALDFQPYFTATASNVGYSWWSHDIGGHGTGCHDNELYARWVQLGVFSPINRLHCTCSDFHTKEPWHYSGEAQTVATDFLRLRHRLIPYLYTAMYKNHEDGLPLVCPLYYFYPTCGDATIRKNEYFFGENLLVCPVTQKADAASHLSEATMWFPEGTYIDFFSNRVYKGGRTLRVYRTLKEMPVFAKAGSIIPLSLDTHQNGTDCPTNMELKVFGGADGSYTLIEDDGERLNSEVCRTTYNFTFGETSTLSFNAPKAVEGVPTVRNYKVTFAAFTRPQKITLSINGKKQDISFKYDELRREITTDFFTVNEGDSVVITHIGDGKLPKNEITNTAFDILMQAECEYHEKNELYRIIKSDLTPTQKLAAILSFDGNRYLYDKPYDGNRYILGFLAEILSAND